MTTKTATCNECGHEWKVSQESADPVRCPECGSNAGKNTAKQPDSGLSAVEEIQQQAKHETLLDRTERLLERVKEVSEESEPYPPGVGEEFHTLEAIKTVLESRESVSLAELSEIESEFSDVKKQIEEETELPAVESLLERRENLVRELRSKEEMIEEKQKELIELSESVETARSPPGH